MLNLDTKEVNKIIKDIQLNDEFEIMFNNYSSSNQLSITQFYDILKYIKYRNENDKIELEKIISLDIIYTSDSVKQSTINYRFSIVGLEKINNFINLVHRKKNNNIFSILVTQFIDDEDIIFIRKEKKFTDTHDINDYDIRVRKSSETKVSTLKDYKKILDTLKNLSIGESQKISFRFKQRLSLIIDDNKKYKLSLDATVTQVTKDINTIYNTNKKYEVELDYMIKNKETKTSKSLNLINEEAVKVKKVLTKTENILSKTEKFDILNQYRKQVFGSNSQNQNNLYSMQPISAELQHIVDKVPSSSAMIKQMEKYAFTFLVMMFLCYLII